MEQPVIAAVAGVIAAYLLGSIPFAWLAGRARGIDLRQHGSGNLGATNAGRVLGVRTGVAIYLLDTFKGFAAAFFVPQLAGLPRASGWAVACGAAAVVGHVRPVFLGFRRGGKGVATAGGVFFGLAWVPALAALLVWILVFAATGYVSVGSLAAAAALPVAMVLVDPAISRMVLGAGVALALFIFWTHRTNVRRLRRGEEHRLPVGFGRARRAPRGTPPQAPRPEQGQRG